MTSAVFKGNYFDGRTSALQPVDVAIDGGIARITGAQVAFELPKGELKVGSRIGDAPQRIALPDGGVILTDALGLSQLLAVPPAQGVAHRLESHPVAMAVAVMGLAIAGYFGYTFGVPWAAKFVAAQLPVSFEEDIAKEALEQLDNLVLRPSELADHRRAILQAEFSRVARAAALPDARVEFRNGKWLGANAFALPGRTIIVTDQLAQVLSNPEVVAVLAHELGHLHHQHSTRQILQASALTLASVAVLGDVSSVGSLAATVPTILLYTGYTRDFEREADQFAFDTLPKVGLSPRLLGASLEKLEGLPPKGARQDAEDGTSYLGTHPATPERKAASEQAARKAGF